MQGWAAALLLWRERGSACCEPQRCCPCKAQVRGKILQWLGHWWYVSVLVACIGYAEPLKVLRETKMLRLVKSETARLIWELHTNCTGRK